MFKTVTGGLTGFAVAKDLMKLDFSPPSEAPEEFRALTFTAPPMVKGQGRPVLLASQIHHQGTPHLHASHPTHLPFILWILQTCLPDNV